MNFEDIKMLARAGFTADEIRAMQINTLAKTESTNPVPVAETPNAETAPTPAPAVETKSEEKNNDFVKEITNKLDALTKAIQAGNRLTVSENNPAPETVDDILKNLMK